jgi:hypothetical protein
MRYTMAPVTEASLQERAEQQHRNKEVPRQSNASSFWRSQNLRIGPCLCSCCCLFSCLSFRRNLLFSPPHPVKTPANPHPKAYIVCRFYFNRLQNRLHTHRQPEISRGLPLHEPRTAVQLLSSPSTPKNSSNQHPINHFHQKNSWHSSYAPRRIIKSVSKTKQTRPIRRVPAFNASVPLQVIANDYFRGNSNGMTILPATTRKSQIFTANPNV